MKSKNWFEGEGVFSTPKSHKLGGKNQIWWLWPNFCPDGFKLVRKLQSSLKTEQNFKQAQTVVSFTGRCLQIWQQNQYPEARFVLPQSSFLLSHHRAAAWGSAAQHSRSCPAAQLTTFEVACQQWAQAQCLARDSSKHKSAGIQNSNCFIYGTARQLRKSSCRYRKQPRGHSVNLREFYHL